LKNEVIEIKHSKKNMTSYGFGKFINEFFNMAFGAFVFFFYESEIGLDSWLTSIGYIIFAIWNAVNDPLIGYLVDRPFKFTKKWGRRFPWVFIGGIPWLFSYILVFTPPSVDPQEGAWILFAWIVIATCLYDTFGSIFNVNFYAIFPDKFRGASERRLASTLSTLVGALGTALGAIIPPLFIVFGDLRSYIVQAGVVIIVLMIALVLAIPGCREDKERIDSYLEKYKKKKERKSFLKEFKACLKHKNFIAYIVAYTFYQSLVQCMIGSIPYAAQFVLGVEASGVTFIMAFVLLGMFVSMPIWARIADKTNNDRKTIIIASIFLTIVTAPLVLINDYFFLLIAMFIWGMGEGGFWVMMSPVLANAIDESVIMTGERKEGIYNGFQTFVGRAALVAQAVSFSMVHTITGFVEGSSTQTQLAVSGIQLHFGLIPMIFMLISTIIMWKFYKLTPEKVKINREKIKELGL